MHPLHGDLVTIVGEGNVIDDPSTLSAYSESIWSPFPPISPGLIVRPGSTNEVAEVLKLANRSKNPIVTRGGGASLTGYPQTDPGRSIILETRRLNRVLEIDPANMVVHAECGMLMSELEEAVGSQGFFVHTVSVPVRYATLGGVLSGVVGGGLPPKGARDGTGQHFILGMKVVLPDGRIINTGAGGSNVNSKADFMRGGSGPDLLGLFMCDGGIFGVKVEATLELSHRPPVRSGGFSYFNDFDSSWKAISRLTLLEPLPYSDVSIYGPGSRLLFYGIDAASQEEVDLHTKRIEKICQEEGGGAAPEDVQAKLNARIDGTSLREDSFVKRTRGLLSFISGKKEFPLIHKTLTEFLAAEIRRLGFEGKGLSVVSAITPKKSHAVYASVSVLFDPSKEGAKTATLEIQKAAYKKAVELGCSPEPHGGYAALMAGDAWSPEFKDTIRGMKALVDPNNILNVGLWGL